MLEIIDQLNEFVLTDNFVLVRFDAANMFPLVLTIGLVLKVLRTSWLPTNLIWIPLNAL